MQHPRHALARYCLIPLYGIGLFLSGSLFSLHFQDGAGAFCDLFSSDCLSTITSVYGSVAGFPVSTLAIGYFTLQLLSVAPPRYQSVLLIRTGNFIALLASMWFIYLMTMVLHETCVLCYGVHMINLIAFLTSLALVSGKSIFALRHHQSLSTHIAPVLAALLACSITNLAIARHQVTEERRKTTENVSYLKYMHLRSQEHSFSIEPDDAVIGKPGLAQHQITLIYKDGCLYCTKAKEELSRTVGTYPTAVYLLLKDYRKISRQRLEEIEVKRAPAVFIDGRRAEGWDVPGFLAPYTEDCGC